MTAKPVGYSIPKQSPDVAEALAWGRNYSPASDQTLVRSAIKGEKQRRSE